MRLDLSLDRLSSSRIDYYSFPTTFFSAIQLIQEIFRKVEKKLQEAALFVLAVCLLHATEV